MPFRSFDDLRYLIQDELPRRMQEVFAKGCTRLEWCRDQIQFDPPDMLDMVNAENIVMAMKDVRCQTDVDGGKEMNDAGMPRFRLRH